MHEWIYNHNAKQNNLVKERQIPYDLMKKQKQKQTKKLKTINQYIYEHRHKNPQKNTRKLIPATYKKE